jgi:hypothetical protein
LNIHNISYIRQIAINTVEPLVAGPSHLEVEISIAMLEKYRSPGSDQIPAELIHAGGEILVYMIYKFINSVWNKEELPDLWKEPIILPVHKKDNKTDCNNYHGISLPSTSYKMLSNIVLSQVSPYINEIIEDHQCGFQRSRSNTDKIFCIHQVLEKKWKYSATVHQLFVDFQIFNPQEIRLIKICVNDIQ